MSQVDWRSRNAYEHLRLFDGPAFAFEYLHRNSNFVQHSQELEEAATRDALDPAEADAFARRWGVRFRDGARPKSKSDHLDR